MPVREETYFEIKPRKALTFDFQELADYRELFYYFTWRDIKVKYKQTIIGVLWAMLQPLLLMVIFTVFLGRTFRLPSDDMQYPVFVYPGLMLWLVFTSGITNAGSSMISNAQIIRKIYFPRLIIPISALLVAVFDFLVATLVLVPLLLYFHQPVSWLDALWCWPAGLLLTVIGTLGPGCLLAALNVKYRDFRYVVPFLIQLLLFVTPVIYPLSIVDNVWLRYVVSLNPMYAALTVFRLPMSAGVHDPMLLWISLTSGLIFLLAGLAYFRKTEDYFADLA